MKEEPKLTRKQQEALQAQLARESEIRTKTKQVGWGGQELEPCDPVVIILYAIYINNYLLECLVGRR